MAEALSPSERSYSSDSLQSDNTSFDGSESGSPQQWNQVTAAQGRLNVLRHRYGQGGGEPREFFGFDQNDQPSLRALSVIAPPEEGHFQLNVSDSRVDPECTGETTLPLSNRPVNPRFAHAQPSGDSSNRPGWTSTMRPQASGVHDVPRVPRDVGPMPTGGNGRTVPRDNIHTRSQLPLRPRATDDFVQPMKMNNKSIPIRTPINNLNRNGGILNQDRQNIAILSPSVRDGNNFSQNVGADNSPIHMFNPNGSDFRTPNHNVNIDPLRPINSNMNIPNSGQNNVPLNRIQNLQKQAFKIPSYTQQVKNSIPSGCQTPVSNNQGRKKQADKGIGNNAMYNSKQPNYSRRLETDVKAGLRKMNRCVGEIQKTVEDADLILRFENTNYQVLSALAPQLEGHLNLLKELKLSLVPFASFCNTFSLTDELFEIEVGIPNWEGWFRRLKARLRELENLNVTPIPQTPTRETSNTKNVKFSTSEFPKYDGTTNYHDWWARWNHLARVSRMDEDNLEIKLKESLVGDIEELIGANMMATGSYKELVEKLRSIYDKPIVKMQETTRKFFSIKPEGSSTRDARKLITACSDVLLRVRQNEMNQESLLMNLALMKFPEKIREKMTSELNRTCPSFKITQKQLEAAFNVISGEIYAKPQDHSMSAYNNQSSTEYKEPLEDGECSDDSEGGRKELF